jgi:hypothetical protein
MDSTSIRGNTICHNSTATTSQEGTPAPKGAANHQTPVFAVEGEVWAYMESTALTTRHTQIQRVLHRPLDELKGRAPSVEEMIADATFQETEHTRAAAHEEAVGISWDHKYGHCFPDLLAPDSTATCTVTEEVLKVQADADAGAASNQITFCFSVDCCCSVAPDFITCASAICHQQCVLLPAQLVSTLPLPSRPTTHLICNILFRI